jgi:hypothetical protein
VRSIAALVLLVLVAAAGFAGVRELTRPQPTEPIAPIILDPGVQAGEAAEDDEGSRRQRRRGEGDGEGGFSPPSPQTAEPGGAEGPDTPPPQIEVPTPPADGSDDDGGED